MQVNGETRLTHFAGDAVAARFIFRRANARCAGILQPASGNVSLGISLLMVLFSEPASTIPARDNAIGLFSLDGEGCSMSSHVNKLCFFYRDGPTDCVRASDPFEMFVSGAR